MAKVGIIYHHYPHYRAPVLRALAASEKHDYQFWGSLDDVAGIKAFVGDEKVHIQPLSFRVAGARWHLRGYWPAILDKNIKALVVIANPNMPASWVIAIIGRLMGKKILFWGHGWLRRESFAKSVFRQVYFRLAHRVLVYGDRARELGSQFGYPRDRIDPVYNSLDYENAQRALTEIERNEEGGGLLPQSFFRDANRPLVICTARITKLCRFDLLFEAASQLASQGKPINILLVGDGPERQSLEERAKRLQLDVCFFGACYDETILARLLYYADVTISPGKIGLTVIHSLTYGTPAITHGYLDEQMPEVEAIEPGRTGMLFNYNESADLARTVNEWFEASHDRDWVRKACQTVVADKWNPFVQARLIDRSVDRAMGIER